MNAFKNERDVSVRQRAVDLLYAMCDRSNAEDIVQEMLTYLETADYAIREEMVGSSLSSPYSCIQLYPMTGSKNSHTQREICDRLRMVFGYHVEIDSYCR
jgi:hypothetical protein